MPILSFWLRKSERSRIPSKYRKIERNSEYFEKWRIYGQPKGFLDSPHEVEVEKDFRLILSFPNPSRRKNFFLHILSSQTRQPILTMMTIFISSDTARSSQDV